MPVAGAAVAVQGFGNVGSIAAELMAEAGMTIVAVSDKSGGLYNPKGLDLADVSSSTCGKQRSWTSIPGCRRASATTSS